MSVREEKQPFVRIYYAKLQKEYPRVLYDPTAFATYVRLLIVADQAWPAAPVLPSATRRADLTLLAEGELVTVADHGIYTIKGYAKERGDRQATAKANADERWAKAVHAREHTAPVPNCERCKRNATALPPQSDRTANTNTSTEASTSPTESANALSYDGERMGTPHLDEQAIRTLVEKTGEPWSRAGDRQLGEYDRLIGAHGLAAVGAAFDRVSAGKRMTARQLVWAAVKVLEPIPNAKDTRAADADDAAEKRSRRIDAEMQARRTEAERWVETA